MNALDKLKIEITTLEGQIVQVQFGTGALAARLKPCLGNCWRLEQKETEEGFWFFFQFKLEQVTSVERTFLIEDNEFVCKRIIRIKFEVG